MEWNKIKGDVVLVGNGPIQENWSGRVSQADHVFRFNFATSDQEKSGTRTDFLAINNVGKPAFQMLSNGLPSQAAGAHIIFGRSVETNIAYYEKCNLSRHPMCLVSTERAMIKHFAIEHCSRLSPQQCAATFECLMSSNGNYDFAMPSIGFQIFHCLIESAPNTQITLIGFTFEGWDGHPWNKECRFVNTCVEDGRAGFLV